MVERQNTAAQQDEEQEKRVRPCQRQFCSQRPRHRQPQRGKRHCAYGDDQQRQRRVPRRTPAVEQHRNPHQQDYLHYFQHQNGEDFCHNQPTAWQRRASQSLQHAIIAFIGCSNAQVHHPRGDDRQRQNAGQQEVDGAAVDRRHNVQRGEKDQQQHGNDQCYQDVLAAPQREQQFIARLAENLLA